MGEVYRGRDTRLDRDVAIKLLPSAFASDPERLARFEREAKLLASLNHPNIAHLYGFETAIPAGGTGAHFIVMERCLERDPKQRLRDIGEARGPLITPYYSVTHDGQRFLVSSIVDTAPGAPLTVVLNWTAAIEK